MSLSERSQSEKAIDCMIPKIGHSEKAKTMETVKGSVVAMVREEARMNRRSTENF
jgi:hypothetical protein